jgi:uncharacterized membrane protein (DUF373 family)
MARNETSYALKSPRGRTQNVAARAFDVIEDGIYIVVAVLLVVAGAFVLWNVVSTLINDVGHTQTPQLVTNLLDNGLLLFIIAELLHTVRATIQERTLVVEPFLIVGIIAGLRRLLLITAQLANGGNTFTWQQQGIEMTVLLALILGITVALVLYHRYHGPVPNEEG